MSDCDTYQPPEHGWTCFHCGETFMHEQPARNHFGAHPFGEPGCILRMQDGEHGLLRKIRAMERELERYHEEDSDQDREIAALRSAHGRALIGAEEKGYARGLRDARSEFDDHISACLA